MTAVPPEPATNDLAETKSMEVLFADLEAPLLGYAYRLSRSVEMSEDLVQEAFLRLHERFDDVREPKPWLYRTVHNLALNQHRRNSKVVPLSASDERRAGHDPESPDPAPLPDEQADHRERIGQLRGCLARLDDRSRELVRLKFNEELSYQEIGARTGLSVGNVGYILHHALKALAAEFSRSEEAL